jgi:hypothetical protein
MKDAMRLAQSLQQQAIEEMGFFDCFSRCPKAPSEAVEMPDSKADSGRQKSAILHPDSSVNGRVLRTC